MNKQVIGFLVKATIPLRVISNTLSKFPEAYIYFINPSITIL